jgi:cyclopropane-fatty-acyl-phospholipid synthase
MSVLSSSEIGLSEARALSRRADSDAPGLPACQSLTALDRWYRSLVMQRLASISTGQLTLTDGTGSQTHGSADSPLRAQIWIHAPRFYRRMVWGGSLGAAESYLDGDWSTDDLTTTMRILARQASTLNDIEGRWSRLWEPVRAACDWRRWNTPARSRRNISAHYDLSNAFFALMLDPTMTYSSGIFPTPESSLQEASLAKYEQVCRKLDLQPEDHVLEVGCGWGGFASYAASRYGCRVTATTISQEQLSFARDRIQREGLQDRVTLLQEDYRHLRGQYDKLVSIEMIEAVGERFLNTYFGCCSRLLRADGMMVLQAITIPDHRYDRYRRSVDFINQYIFPGGFLPSVAAIGQALRYATDFRLFHLEDFGVHYARTLACWRERMRQADREIRALGFDDRFFRTWEYYLCYCEAGFEERQIGVSQWVLTKPLCRREPVLVSFPST